MSKQVTKTGCVALLLSVPMLIILNAVISGLVLQQLWYWFITPIFKLPTLSIPLAIGLMITVEMFKSGLATSSKDEKSDSVSEAIITSLARTLVTPIYCLVAGWLVHGMVR